MEFKDDGEDVSREKKIQHHVDQGQRRRQNFFSDQIQDKTSRHKGKNLQEDQKKWMLGDRIERNKEEHDVLGVIGQEIHVEQRRIKFPLAEIPQHLRVQGEVPIVVPEGIIFQGQNGAPENKNTESDGSGP